jgi:subfamily B ATP-binding cassette protein MsbA
MLMIMAPLKPDLTDVNAPIQRGLAAAESVFSLIDEDAEADSGQGRRWVGRKAWSNSTV